MLETAHPLERIIVPGHHGAAGAGVTITDRRGLALCQLMAGRGKAGELAERFSIVGEPGKATVMRDFTALPLAQGHWMLIGDDGRDGLFARKISARAAGLGYASDQSHGRVILRLEGPKARDVMRKGCRLDLHPRVTATGFCAQTQMAQIGVIIHQVADRPAYDLIVFAGLAQPFFEWLCDAAAEFGYELAITQTPG